MVAAASKSVFSLTPLQLTLWKSQQSAHSFDWLGAVHIFGYSGLPLNTARTTVDMYGILINKIQASIQHWSSSKLLSYAGTLQLLNTVVFGLENCWCANALLPKSVIKTINKLCKNFFWNIKTTDKRMVAKSWSSICSPPAEGGFGVKELLYWNKALISKCVKGDLLTATGSSLAARALLQSWCSGDKFSVTAVYNWFKPYIPIVPWHSGLSHKVVIPRHDIISSLACQQKLATVDNLI
ncbi:uncharacterized protein LOC141600589 [Silene latifolia]|uniref:uncharacterized protein LOC141600589 n=1 Tax=Silene latifolia TaxID=37657 RepID=UPI003D780560